MGRRKAPANHHLYFPAERPRRARHGGDQPIHGLVVARPTPRTACTTTWTRRSLGSLAGDGDAAQSHPESNLPVFSVARADLRCREYNKVSQRPAGRQETLPMKSSCTANYQPRGDQPAGIDQLYRGRMPGEAAGASWVTGSADLHHGQAD